jgi:hypothetical protein
MYTLLDVTVRNAVFIFFSFFYTHIVARAKPSVASTPREETSVFTWARDSPTKLFIVL